VTRLIRFIFYKSPLLLGEQISDYGNNSLAF